MQVLFSMVLRKFSVAKHGADQNLVTIGMPTFVNSFSSCLLALFSTDTVLSRALTFLLS